MLHISLFSGIGGFELAAEWAGWKNIASCEINEFGRKVLDYYWPDTYHHNDIHTLTIQKLNEELTKRYGTEWRSDDIILTGGFPCQPYSVAGKKLGDADDRHLWPEMLRVIREVQPSWVVGENVLGIVSWNRGLVFEEVQTDLEAEGYEVQTFILPAASVGAPHRRDRVWFVAHSRNESRRGTERCSEVRKRELLQSKQQGRKVRGQSSRLASKRHATDTLGNRLEYSADRRTKEQVSEEATQRGQECISQLINPTKTDSIRRHASDTQSKRQQPFQEDRTEELYNEKKRSVYGGSGYKYVGSETWDNFPTKSPVCSRDDGLSAELVGITFSKHRNESIKAYGNAIVPQVAFQIFNAINLYRSQTENKRKNTQ